MISKTPFSFAVIGQGHIGKRHAEMIRRNSEARLIAVCDILPADATGVNPQDYAYYTDAADMLLKHPEIEVVHICTPNGLHAQQALLALEHRKHVVIEKPMALSTFDAERIIQTALIQQRQVFCVMQNRYSPPSVWLKYLCDNRILGQIFMVQLNCYWNRDARYYKSNGWKGTQDLDGGTLFTQFSHWIDILFWLFGDIKQIQARFADFNHQQHTDFEDSGLVTFEFENGGMGCINYSTAVWDKNLESSLTIMAENGSIKIGGQYMDQVEYCHIQNYSMPKLAPTNPANDYGAYKGSANNHHNVIENVIETLKGKQSVSTNAMEGLKVVDIIERIYKLRNKNLLKSRL
ncbi:MAG: Gfo/Idh/MocA family protein [Bacteroidota bacterium]|jgi:predicted dehydrogenase